MPIEKHVKQLYIYYDPLRRKGAYRFAPESQSVEHTMSA
jgi:hypothetical protein